MLRRSRHGSEAKRADISSREKEILARAGMVAPLLKARGKDPKFLTLNYNHGTPCDLDAINRTTIVELYCGNG